MNFLLSYSARGSSKRCFLCSKIPRLNIMQPTCFPHKKTDSSKVLFVTHTCSSITRQLTKFGITMLQRFESTITQADQVLKRTKEVGNRVWKIQYDHLDSTSSQPQMSMGPWVSYFFSLSVHNLICKIEDWTR